MPTSPESTVINKILVPIDGSEYSKRALELACELAEKFDARLHLLHVILTPTKNLTLIPGDISLTAVTPRGEIEEAGHKMMEAARQIAHDHGCEKVETKVIGGPAAQRILESAKSNEVDMIVMGSRGLSDIDGLMVGRVKHKVSDLAECTCVTVR